jgi:hypothetical protein
VQKVPKLAEAAEEEFLSAVRSLWAPHQQTWAIACGAGDVEACWKLCSETAEAALLLLCQNVLEADPSRYAGRSQAARVRVRPLCGRRAQPLRPGDADIGELPAASHQQQALMQQARRAETLARLLRRRLAMAVPGAAGVEERHAWEAMLRAGPGPLLASEHAHLWQGKASMLPPLPALEAVVSALQAECRKITDEIRTRRIQNHRSRLRGSWTGSRSAVFEWVAPPRAAPTVMLTRPDGTWTASPNEIDQLFRDAWLPVFGRHARQAPPAWAPFQQRFGQYIRSCPLELPPLQTADLRDTLRRMSARQAAGVEGWRVAEVQRLPDLLLAQFAELFGVIENTGQWPDALSDALVTLIPKGEGAQPLQQRPITVASVIYRLWAATRLRSLMQWQELWISQSQHGCRKGHDAFGCFFDTALAVEAALLSGEGLVGVYFDYAKCFDRIPHGILMAVARATGLPEVICRPLEAMMACMRRRFRLAAGVGEAFVSSNGVLQGCPLSVLMLNLLVCIWSNAVAAEVPTATPRAYADDTGARAPDVASIQAVISLTGTFTHLTDQELNVKKCSAWATTKTLGKEIRQLSLNGVRLHIASTSETWAPTSASTTDGALHLWVRAGSRQYAAPSVSRTSPCPLTTRSRCTQPERCRKRAMAPRRRLPARSGWPRSVPLSCAPLGAANDACAHPT